MTLLRYFLFYLAVIGSGNEAFVLTLRGSCKESPTPGLEAPVNEDLGFRPGRDIRPISFLIDASGLSSRSFGGLSGKSSRTRMRLVCLRDRIDASIELKIILCFL